MAMTFELGEKIDGYLPTMHVVNIDPDAFVSETREAGQEVEVHKIGDGVCESVVEVDLVPNADD